MHTIALVTPGPTEWVLILVIVLVLFGAKKLPELARSLGQSMNEFRKAREDFDKELHAAGSEIKGAAPHAIPAGAEPTAVPASASSATAQPARSAAKSAFSATDATVLIRVV